MHSLSDQSQREGPRSLVVSCTGGQLWQPRRMGLLNVAVSIKTGIRRIDDFNLDSLMAAARSHSTMARRYGIHTRHIPGLRTSSWPMRGRRPGDNYKLFCRDLARLGEMLVDSEAAAGLPEPRASSPGLDRHHQGVIKRFWKPHLFYFLTCEFRSPPRRRVWSLGPETLPLRASRKPRRGAGGRWL